MSEAHGRDPHTDRPVGDGHELLSELTDDELREELMIAAMARDHRRIERFERLLAERDRRRDSSQPASTG